MPGDGPEWNALQPEAGMFEERVFAALDWVIAEAGARGIRLSLPLVNYWPAYGGIPQYVRSAPATTRPHVVHSAIRSDMDMDIGCTSW